MEHQEFDQLARESVGASTRRTLVRGLAALFGVAGVGLVLADDADAKKSKKKKRRQRKRKQKRRKEKKQECNSKKACPQSNDPCKVISCENNKCVTSNAPDGTSCAAGGRVCLSGVCGCPAGNTQDVQVTPSSLKGWFGYDDVDDVINNDLLVWGLGPDDPPYGDGSVSMSVTGDERKNIATYQFSGIKLADISELKFTTYNPSASNNTGLAASGYLHFNVDFDGSDTWQSRLVYVPRNNGTVEEDEWQEWDAIDSGDAVWTYSGDNWPGDGLPGETKKTWSEILEQYPDVRIRVTDAFLGIRVGEPYEDGFTGHVGSVTLASCTANQRFVFGPDE
jgi:hypothetical protein